MTKESSILPTLNAIKKSERGVLVVSILIIATVILVVGLSLMTFTISHYSRTTNNVFAANATQVAEAGIEQSLYELNQDDSFAGFETEEVFFDNETQGRGVFITTVEDSEDSNAKIITATSRIFRYNRTDAPISTRTIKVTVVGTSSPGYAVHTGPGGLILGGSAAITNSEVYVNGTITLEGASKIGTPTQPLNVHVAHQVCPAGSNPGPTYPQVCSTGQPISLQWSTKIYGTVCATGQTTTGPDPAGNILPGTTGQGLVMGCVAPPASPPTYDRAAHIASMQTIASGSSNTYTCQQWPFERTWPANLQLNGNTTIAGSCDVVIRGNAYISGNLDIGGAARITVDESVGGTRPVIVVDGNITVGGSAAIIANSHGTGIQFISFRSNAPCNPNCTTITGTALKNTQNLETVTIGGAVNLPGMIFQSYWSKARLAGSGNVGSIVGQTVDMQGAGTVIFGTTLSSGSKTWTITSYQQVFNN